MNGDTIDYHLAQIHTKMKRIYLLLMFELPTK